MTRILAGPAEETRIKSSKNDKVEWALPFLKSISVLADIKGNPKEPRPSSNSTSEPPKEPSNMNNQSKTSKNKKELEEAVLNSNITAYWFDLHLVQN